MFRSIDISFCEIIIENSVAFKVIAALGKLSLVQFLNPNDEAAYFKLKFANEVQLCDAIERKIDKLEQEIISHAVKIERHHAEIIEIPLPSELSKLDQKLHDLDQQLDDEAANIARMTENRIELAQLQGVLEVNERYFNEIYQQNSSISSAVSATAGPSNLGRRVSTTVGDVPIPAEPSATQLVCLTGVIDREATLKFEQMLWRVSRGNIFVRSTNLDLTVKDENISKLNVFIAFFKGQALKTKVELICKAFHARIFACPEKTVPRLCLMAQVQERRQDIDEILERAIEHRRKVLETIAKQCDVWKEQTRKIKLVYHTLNMLTSEQASHYLIGQCWCPTDKVDFVQSKLAEALPEDEKSKFIFSALDMPDDRPIPTLFKKNKLLKAFQSITDAYSVAKYKEINPAVFSAITFPFLFAVMFGDVGHGVIVTAFATWMCLAETKLKNSASKSEFWRMIFGGRYVILLMGIFSIYAGFLYNDCFAKSMNIFGSKWEANFNVSDLVNREKWTLEPLKWPYPLAIDPVLMDPVWETADNRINYINSMKMKLSVILGVAQMILGIFLSLTNYLYHRQWIDVFCQFLPQLLFLCCLFLYMDALIVFKWIYFDASKSGQAPSILINMINMCLFKYSEETEPDRFISQNLMHLQYVLFIIAMLCVPVMLLIKPFYERAKHQRQMEIKRKIRHFATLTSSQVTRISDVNLESGYQHRRSTYQTRQLSSISSEDTGFEDLFQLSKSSRRVSQSVLEVRRRSSVKVVPVVYEPKNVEAGNEFMFSEIFIHQAIHTIEFVLGLISHTASYLRLWALSLAHSELSNVLWKMIFRRGLSMANSDITGFIAIFIVFILFACLTLAILVMMEGMSAFLHALRLHWVEFQSKFYQGGGTVFQPFNFKLRRD